MAKRFVQAFAEFLSSVPLRKVFAKLLLRGVKNAEKSQLGTMILPD